MPRQQLSVKDSPAPGLPHQSSTASENPAPQGGANESTENTPSNQPAKSTQQTNQQHLLKPTGNKQVRLEMLSLLESSIKFVYLM